MKLVTHRCFVVLAMIIAIVGISVWLDRRDTPIREGRVVIDQAFLHRWDTENPRTSRDPAIQAISHGFTRENIRASLSSGDRRLSTFVGLITIQWRWRSWFTFGGMDSITEMTYTRNKRNFRDVLSPKRWKELFQPREYWKLDDVNWRGDY